MIECVPNFSTSDPEVVETILREIKQVKGAHILDYTYDAYYNRLVVTCVGDKTSILNATLMSAIKAVELIDMNEHEGQHPRIGAVDVVPFIPVHGRAIQDCVALANAFGEAFAEECHVPVYLYGKAASSPERIDLDWIRKGEYEQLSELMKHPGRRPDFGPASPHPTAGATIAGAREIMVGFNVNLNTADLETAKKIARALHGKKGGLTYVKAMAAKIPEKKITQIGMSVGKQIPLHRVFELIKIEARRYNVPILSSEFCGIVPLQAIIDTAKYYLKIDQLDENRVIEVAARKALEKDESHG